MKLIYSVQEIKYLNNYFKLYSEELDEKSFFNEEIMELLNKAPAMRQGFSASYYSGKYLQPGYLTEINVCATLAKMMKLNYDNNISEPNLRHLYSNDGVYLKEYGGCGMSDIQLISNDTIITIEVKEPLSLGGDFDLGITEEGKLLPKIALNREFPESAQKILDDFNKIDSVFNHLGHNIPLSNAEYLKGMLDSYLGDKQIDYIATYSNADGELIYFPSSEIYNHVDFKGSEIRTAGKNKVKVYTPEAFKKAMLDIGCSIDNTGLVTIPKDKIEYRVARGSNGCITGIKINPIFYFEIGNIIKEDDNFYYADIKNGKQLKQSISVHLNLK